VARSLGAGFRLQVSDFRHQEPSTRHQALGTRNQARLFPLNSQLSTLNSQLSTLNSQLSTLNSQRSTLISHSSSLSFCPSIFLSFALLGIALRASRNSWDSGSTMGSSLTPPPYLSALPSFCHLPSLGIALRASKNSWDSGSTMGSTLNPQPTTILRLCENDHQVFSPGTPSTDRRFSSNRPLVASVLHMQ